MNLNVLIYVVLASVVVFDVNAQIGVTKCTSNADCAVHENALCDTLNTGTCVCAAALGFIPNAANDACTYQCGDPPEVADGSRFYLGTVTDSQAIYSCDAGFQLVGTGTLVCETSSGWGTAPTCNAGKLGDICGANTDLCVNIGNGECNGIQCACLAGYQDDGTTYACVDIDECLSNPCQNAAPCSNLLDDYSCACTTGWTDKNCDVNPDDCDPLPCQNGGSCTDGLATYTCACVAGYTGTDCEINIDECQANICQNAATCHDGINEYTCECPEGFTGVYCGTNIDDCVGHNCVNGATCVDGISTFTCSCAPGYNDLTCSTNINECQGVVCQNGGNCVDGINSYTCSCVSGYEGTHCEINIDECVSHTCINGATCIDGIAQYTCNCVNGYDGQYCGTNIDDCDPDPCQNGALCTDQVADYSCACVLGYEGKNCQTDTDDCATVPCQNGATCDDQVNDYTCTCVTGYEGKNCEIDVDDCASNQCRDGASCVDNVNYYTCTCPTGYEGIHCENNIDDCIGNICQNGAACVDQIDNYVCTCEAGFTGQFCTTNINECQNNTCQNGATCVDLVNSYICACVDGYDGTFCQNDIDECLTNSCVHGICVDIINGYTCTCDTGYSGRFCSINDDDCSANPCQNGATCTDGVANYTCTCAPGYTGGNCETEIDECLSNPCENDATCNNLVNKYTCDCEAGFSGINCQTDIDECAVNPCMNSGNCTDQVNDFSCECVAGYTDKTCSTNINECTSNVCENGATCVDQVNNYTCTCMPGYADRFCQTNIIECVSNPCKNGGTCNDGVNSYTCTCVTGYTGIHCETNINECASNPCVNGGTCTDQVNGFVCACADGFTGTTCRAAVLGDNCSVRAEVCANINHAECDGTGCVCSSGYQKTGPAICSPVDCGSLTAPANGQVDHSETTVYPMKAYFSCSSGYTRMGAASATCQADASWDAVPHTCQIKDCGTIAAPANGAVTFVPGTEYQGNAEFTCNTGYTLVGVNSRSCLDSGSWSDSTPVCNINDCGLLTAPANGGIDQATGTTYLSVTEFTCDPGYSLVGNSQITCEVSAWSSSKPVCQIKDCGDLPDPTNGQVADGQGTTFGAVVTYTCNIGYFLVGVSSRVCQASGFWHDTDPVCQIKDCGVLTNPDDGNVDITGGTEYQNEATYSCDPGFELNGILKRTCNSDGNWSSVAPTCDRVDCGNIRAITNGAVDQTAGTLYEAIAYFTCNAGYTLIGATQTDCLADATWSATSPTCQIKDCGPLSSPTNGQVLTVHGTTYGEEAVYSCELGYMVNGVASRLCEADGQWSASDPTCVILDCGPVANISHGSISYSPGTLFGATVYYTCFDGYEVTGASSRVCLSTAAWSDSQPACTILDCDEAVVISNGVVKTPSGSQVGDMAIYECNTGYGLVGDAQVPCEPTGYWGTVPECRLDCGTPPTVNNSAVVVPAGTLVGATATYTCNDGYSISGLPVITCETTGRWGNDPFCNIIFKSFNAECFVTAQCVTVGAKCRDDTNAADRCLCAITGEFYDATIDHCLADCGSLPHPTNGEVDLPDITAAGQIAVYSCFTGYALNAPAIRTCQNDGTWSGVAPLCVSGCPYPPSPDNGYVNTSDGLAAGDIVRYYCNNGYSLVGEPERVCLTDSQWSGNMPSCAVECPALTVVEHGSVDLSQGNWEGSKATYICVNNYALVGVSTRTCEATGQWSGIQPECVFAIFPDVLLVFGTLFVFLILVDIFILAFCVYMRYCKHDGSPTEVDDKKKVVPDVLDEEQETGMPPDDFMHAGIPASARAQPPPFGKKARPPRIAPDTKRELLRGHPPPKKGQGSKVFHMTKDQKRPNVLKKLFNKKYGSEFDELERSTNPLEDMSPFTAKPATPKPPVDVEVAESSSRKLREESTVEMPQTDRDGGYGTATSDDNKFNTSLELDNSSIENINMEDGGNDTLPDIRQPTPIRPAETSSPKENRRPMMDTDIFKGRAPIPPLAETPVSIDQEKEKPFREESRKKLKGTVNSYIPAHRPGRVS